jgi:hypothetical protein
MLESPEPTKRRVAKDQEYANIEIPKEIHQNKRITDLPQSFN